MDKQRLEAQIEKFQKTEQRLTSISDAGSWDFPIPGSERDNFIPLHPVIPADTTTLLFPQATLPVRVVETDSKEGELALLHPKRSSLMRRGSVATAERRRALWAGFEPSHQLTHLPEDLSRHEQAEGTVLAVGVVAPTSNALENQVRAYGGETSMEMPDPTCILPVPAPPGLIQQWLNELRQLNAPLDAATVIIRQVGGSGKSSSNGTKLS